MNLDFEVVRGRLVCFLGGMRFFWGGGGSMWSIPQ